MKKVILLMALMLIGCEGIADKGKIFEITLSNGDIIYCGNYANDQCGLYVFSCVDGSKHECVTNAKIKQIPKQ